MKLHTVAQKMQKMVDGKVQHGTFIRDTEVITDDMGIIRWKGTNAVVALRMLEDNGIEYPESQFNEFVKMCKRYAEWCSLVKPMKDIEAGNYMYFTEMLMGSDISRATSSDATPRKFSEFLSVG